MRFAFAGTPQFAAWVLRDLADAGHPPCLVVSQPGRPAGRGRPVTDPPAAREARAAGVPVLQTADINQPEVAAALEEAGAESLVVAAFGQLLRPALLDAYLCVNVHASLLPAYRGAAPIARALMAGERETGVSLMRMTPGLDEGPWALQRRLALTPRDEAGPLGRVLALLGAQGVLQVLTGLEQGNVTWTDQVGTATYAAKLDATDRRLDLDEPAERVHDHVRALAPDIGAQLDVGVRTKVLRTWPRVSTTADDSRALRDVFGKAWSLGSADGRLFAGCGQGAVEILVLQPAGKRPMAAAEFLRGYERRLTPQARRPQSHTEGGV